MLFSNILLIWNFIHEPFCQAQFNLSPILIETWILITVRLIHPPHQTWASIFEQLLDYLKFGMEALFSQTSKQQASYFRRISAILSK